MPCRAVEVLKGRGSNVGGWALQSCVQAPLAVRNQIATPMQEYAMDGLLVLGDGRQDQ